MLCKTFSIPQTYFIPIPMYIHDSFPKNHRNYFRWNCFRYNYHLPSHTTYMTQRHMEGIDTIL